MMMMDLPPVTFFVALRSLILTLLTGRFAIDFFPDLAAIMRLQFGRDRELKRAANRNTRRVSLTIVELLALLSTTR